jgi:hypothetical protein
MNALGGFLKTLAKAGRAFEKQSKYIKRAEGGGPT